MAIFTILKQHGRVAVVLPANVLFTGGTVRCESSLGGLLKHYSVKKAA